MTTAPDISIIMPVFQASRFLGETLKSIVRQTHRSFELLAFDDGSTDGSIQTLNEFARNDKRIIVCLRKHQGYTPHLNEGLQMARSKYVARMDADDICFPQRLETQFNYLEANPVVVAVGSDIELIDEFGDSFSRQSVPSHHEDIDSHHLNFGGGVFPHPSVMMRRESAIAVGGYRVVFEPAEDIDLWLRLAEVGRLANISEPLLKYRVHDGMVSREKFELQQQNMRRAITEACHRRQITVPKTHLKAASGPGGSLDPHLFRLQQAIRNGFPCTAFRYACRRILASPISPARWWDFARSGYAMLRESR